MTEPAEDILQSREAGRVMVQGGIVRVLALAAGTGMTMLASIVLLRFLGLADFGRFTTGMAIIATVQGITDAGLTLVASRELANLPPGAGRRTLMANLVGLRVAIAPLLVALATGFAVVAGYPDEVVEGVLIGSIGIALMSIPLALTALLAVELRNVRAAVFELIRQASLAVAFVALVILSAPLELIFAAQIFAAVVMLATVPALVGKGWAVMPRFDLDRWRHLLARSLPVAVSYAISLVYFRVMLIFLSLTANETQTGLFATSLRIFELLLAFPTLALSVALPLLTASIGDADRLRYQLQRLTDTTLLAGAAVAVVICLGAVPLIELIGGSEYEGVPEILRIHVFAFIPLCLGLFAQIALLALGHQRDLIRINIAALAFMLTASAIVIPRWEALGAAWTAIVAETLLAMLAFVVLRHRARETRPTLAGAWRVGAAAALAVGAGLALPVGDLPATIAGAAVFVLAANLLKAIPGELFEALPARARPFTRT